ncbi:MAG: hypothetical protein MUE79_02315 [Nitratireductor sp.]|nr:hypothetical protein [Nitratireductor sp.]
MDSPNIKGFAGAGNADRLQGEMGETVICLDAQHGAGIARARTVHRLDRVAKGLAVALVDAALVEGGARRQCEQALAGLVDGYHRAARVNENARPGVVRHRLYQVVARDHVADRFFEQRQGGFELLFDHGVDARTRGARGDRPVPEFHEGRKCLAGDDGPENGRSQVDQFPGVALFPLFIATATRHSMLPIPTPGRR